jgi:serine protease Do
MIRTDYSLRRSLLGLALAVPLVAAPAFASPPSATDGSPLATAQHLGVAFSQVAEQVSPSVVSIQVEVKQKAPNMGFFMPFGMPEGGTQKGGGSGVIISGDGAVLTNNHVVDQASRIEVVMQDGRKFPAKVVGVDPATDLAVLRIEAKGLTAARFADSDASRVGQWVVAIGSPFGLDYTVTAGVLSAKGRGGLGANEIEDYLQTDASINPGNSGGPLVNLNGEVLGINTMIIGNSGIGFAIPSNLARKVSQDLLQKGDVSRAWIGVSFQELTPELASSFGLSNMRGALVNDVSAGGPAQKAGVRAGDIITGVQDKTVREGRDLLRAVLQYPVGEKLTLTVQRDGKEQKIAVATAERPDARELRAAASGNRPKAAEKSLAMRGADVQDLTPELARRIGYAEGQGVVVSNVQPGSSAERAGLMRGDVIQEANRRPVNSRQKLEEALGSGRALLKVHRHGGSFFAVLE